MNSYPNSDCKQCTESKLGWVHSAHTQNPGRERSAHVVGAATLTASLSLTCRARSQRRSCAQRAQVARIALRSWAHVATSFPCPVPGQVATSLPDHDLLDDQARSRSQPHVATSLMPNQNNLGRDLKNGVATPISIGQAEPCRDIKSVSRHHLGLSRSRHQN